MNLRARAIAVVLAGAITIGGGTYLSKRSLETIKPLSIEMQQVTHCAALILPKNISFTAYHGLRTDAEQRSMIARGVTWVNRSRHQDGQAVDVMAIVDGKGTWDHTPYYMIAKAFYACGEALNVPITWGGEWMVRDMVHFERKR